MDDARGFTAGKLTSLGSFALVIAILLVALQWFLPGSAPAPTEAQKLAPDAYQRALDSMMWEFSLKIYAGYFGDRLLSAGFLMWLVGTALKIRARENGATE